MHTAVSIRNKSYEFGARLEDKHQLANILASICSQDTASINLANTSNRPMKCGGGGGVNGKTWSKLNLVTWQKYFSSYFHQKIAATNGGELKEAETDTEK